MKLIILTGFLGSGKTTLLLEMVRGLLARQPARYVVLENEVGEVDVDGSYLSGQGLEVRELFAGCVCCQLAGALVPTLEEIESSLHPDAVFMEASGMANAHSIVDALDRYCRIIEKRLVVSLADLDRLEMLLEIARPLITSQLEPAQVVLLTKSDLVNPNETQKAAERIAQINPNAEIIGVSALRGEGIGDLIEWMWRWWN